MDRLTLYDVAPEQASQVNTTCPMPAVAFKLVGADGGGNGVALTTAESLLSCLC